MIKPQIKGSLTLDEFQVVLSGIKAEKVISKTIVNRALSVMD
jgi:hypothetical protein